MHSGHLKSEEFFARLSAFFESRKSANHGSIFLTQKRLSHGNSPEMDTFSPTAATPFSDLKVDIPLPVLVRATNGKDSKGTKLKLSTVVDSSDLGKFYLKYTEICKAGMTGLKKRDRSGRKAKERKKKKGKEEKEPIKG